MTTNNLLKSLIDDLGGATEVASKLVTSTSTVWKWTSPHGYNGLPPIKTLLRLADLASKKGVYIDIEKIARASDEWKNFQSE